MEIKQTNDVLDARVIAVHACIDAGGCQLLQAQARVAFALVLGLVLVVPLVARHLNMSFSLACRAFYLLGAGAQDLLEGFSLPSTHLSITFSLSYWLESDLDCLFFILKCCNFLLQFKNGLWLCLLLGMF